MRTNRRGALALLGLGGAAAAATSAEATRAPVVGFHHGVASGDPLQDRVVVWTRIKPEREDWDGEMQGWLEIAREPSFQDVRTIPVKTSRARDWTVKVDVDGLAPGTEYFYRFKFSVYRSPVGRTRTLPDGKIEDVVLAVASCSLYPMGFFNAYGAIASLERVDAVLHLGDYIYEYGAEPGAYGMASPVSAKRTPIPAHECVTLADYRARHASYKTDPQLQAAHARAPWIVVWDDHEVCNDTWSIGAENHNPDKGEGSYADRKAAALKAYFEWMPIRDPAPGGLLESSWRSFRFGDLASVMMVETRLTARVKPLEYDAETLPFVDGKPDIARFHKVWKDPARQLMGQRQEQWLAGELNRSVKAGETWQVIGNQVVMARVLAPNLRAKMGDEAFGAMLARLPADIADIVKKSSGLAALDLPLNLDAWDGYPAARERLYDLFKTARANPVVLSGDSHSFWANELWDEGRLNRVAAEFGTTGVTSPGYADILGADVPIGVAVVERNPEVKWAESAPKGFVLLTLTRAGAKAEMRAVSTIFEPDFTVSTLKTFSVTPAEGVGVGALTEG